MLASDNTTISSIEHLPEQVFHYTSLDTMTKIVQTRSMWCTALPYLNDSKERSFLFDAIAARLPAVKEAEKSIDPNVGLQVFEFANANDLTCLADEAFIACFAESHDSLMHWRAYCPQESGVAIGFRSACLKEARIDERPLPGIIVPQVSFGPVRYIDTSDTKLLDEIISRAYEAAKGDFERPDSWATINHYFRWALDGMGCMCKQKSFEVEEEFRLLLHYARYRENNIHFRTVRSTLIPYVPMIIPGYSDAGPVFDFEKKNDWNAIQTVVVGPTTNMSLTLRSVKAFFQQRGMSVDVLDSQIPYRDW